MTWYQKASYLTNTHQAPNFTEAAKLLRRSRKPKVQPNLQATTRLPYNNE